MRGDPKLSDFLRGRRDLLRSAAPWVSGVVSVGAAPSAGAWQVQEMDPTTLSVEPMRSVVAILRTTRHWLLNC
jgi:hypothetical protein